MQEELKALLDKSKGREVEIHSFLRKNKKNKQLDNLFHQAHEEVFETMDCLQCANCCKTTSPIFRDADVRRIAKHLRMKDAEFITMYLKTDEDFDMVLTSSPCPFLESDNRCSIYAHRPLACREYPHTNRKHMHQILSITEKNSRICPAVSQILDKIMP